MDKFMDWKMAMALIAMAVVSALLVWFGGPIAEEPVKPTPAPVTELPLAPDTGATTGEPSAATTQ